MTPPRAYEQRGDASDYAITEAEVGGTSPGAIENQRLLLDENGLGPPRHAPRRDQRAERQSPADGETGRIGRSLRRESRFEGETSAGYIRGPQDSNNDRCRSVDRCR